jgi:hypothetical protein
MNETDPEPAGHQGGLAAGDGIQEGDVGSLAPRQIRIVAGDGVVGQLFDRFRPPPIAPTMPTCT